MELAHDKRVTPNTLWPVFNQQTSVHVYTYKCSMQMLVTALGSKNTHSKEMHSKEMHSKEMHSIGIQQVYKHACPS